MRTWVLMLSVVTVAAGLGGCGSDSAPVSTPRPAATAAKATGDANALTPAGAPGSVSASAGDAVALGITPAQLEANLGGAATPMRPFNDGFDCTLYRIAEEPPFVKLRYCFRHGRLKFFSTYAVEGSR